MKKIVEKLKRKLRPAPDMARDWEARAQENALHYIADFREQWDDLDEFFLTGKHDVDKLMAMANWLEDEMKRGRLLEIGCGVGRMTRHFADHFDHVVGIDISPTMIQRAGELNGHLANASFRVNSGSDLADFETDSFDFVLSYIVFQHIPSEDIIAGYIAESLRVLKPSGTFFFQARNMPQYEEIGTYAGAPISVERVKRIAVDAGRQARVVEGEGTLFCYFEIK